MSTTARIHAAHIRRLHDERVAGHVFAMLMLRLGVKVTCA
jgi:hypothetical protein